MKTDRLISVLRLVRRRLEQGSPIYGYAEIKETYGLSDAETAQLKEKLTSAYAGNSRNKKVLNLADSILRAAKSGNFKLEYASGQLFMIRESVKNLTRVLDKNILTNPEIQINVNDETSFTYKYPKQKSSITFTISIIARRAKSNDNFEIINTFMPLIIRNETYFSQINITIEKDMKSDFSEKLTETGNKKKGSKLGSQKSFKEWGKTTNKKSK